MPPSTLLPVSPNLHRKPIQIKRRYVIVLALLFVIGYAYIYVWTSRTRGTLLVETGSPKSESSLDAITNMSGFDTPYVWSGSYNRSDRKALKKLTDSCNPNPRKSLRVKEFSSFHSLVKTLPPISMLDKRCVSVIEADRDGWSLYDEHLCRHRFIFVSGLHHSGTSLTNYILQTHDDISGHMDTGAGQDEGVQLQKEYPSAMNYGGACNFLFNKEIYLNSDHETANTKTRRCVMAQWSKNWDLSKEILLEKSPPTLVQLEYRDYLFPYVSAHIIVVRHPLYMCFLKTLSDDLKSNWPLKGRAKKKLRQAIDGWLRAHEFLSLQSVPSVTSKVAILQYETYFNKTVSITYSSYPHYFFLKHLKQKPPRKIIIVTWNIDRKALVHPKKNQRSIQRIYLLG